MFYIHRKILPPSQKRETCFWAALKSLTLGNAVRTNSMRGRGTGRLWIGECTLFLICLIFEWQHWSYYEQMCCLGHPIEWVKTKIPEFCSRPSNCWVTSSLRWLWPALFSSSIDTVRLWSRCRVLFCQAPRHCSDKWRWQQLLRTSAVTCTDGFIKILSEIFTSHVGVHWLLPRAWLQKTWVDDL